MHLSDQMAAVIAFALIIAQAGEGKMGLRVKVALVWRFTAVMAGREIDAGQSAHVVPRILDIAVANPQDVGV